MCTDLRKLIMEIQAKWGHSPSVGGARNMTTLLKLASDGERKLRDKECTTVAKQLQAAAGTAHIAMYEANLLVQMVGSTVSSYPLQGMTLPSSFRRNR